MRVCGEEMRNGWPLACVFDIAFEELAVVARPTDPGVRDTQAHAPAADVEVGIVVGVGVSGDCYVKMEETEIDLASMLLVVVVVVVQDLMTSEKRIISNTLQCTCTLHR